MTNNLTVTDIEGAYEHPEWLGWGYLGERQREESRRKVETADKAVIRFANEEGWDYDQLFWWLNSKPGRWFGDAAFGCTPRTIDRETLGSGRWTITKLVEYGRRCGILYDVLAEYAAEGDAEAIEATREKMTI